MAERPALSTGFGADKTEPRKTPKEVAKAANKVDGRTLRKTGRTEQLATRVTPEFRRRIHNIAQNEGILIVEVLERALKAYDSR